MPVRNIEPYHDQRLPERFLRWIEVGVRRRFAAIPCYTESTGSPEGVIDGVKADRYYDLTGNVVYIKTVDGGNTGWVAAGGGAPFTETMFSKPSDESRISTVTLANDADLVAMPLAASTVYRVEGVLIVTAATQVPDFRGNWTTTATFNYIEFEQYSKAGIANNGNRVFVTGSQMAQGIGIPIPGNMVCSISASGLEPVYISAIIDVNAAGTLTLQWSQNTSNATPTFLRRGSYLRFTEIP